MSGTSVTTSKYVVHARFEVSGVVEKPDVIGAIFGHTEGLFGPDLDLRELQKNNRVGRIEVEMKIDHNKTTGSITVMSSLDRASTSILAAAIESVDRIGPCEAKVSVDRFEDVREGKRKHIVKRAKELLKKWNLEAMPETDDVLKEIGEAVKPSDVSSYGPEQLPSGPDIHASPSLIVVEGRADVINLLRCGIRNVIAVEGARAPDTVVRLSKEKEVTAFLDGDRAGDLIQKELTAVADVRFVSRAPPGKEVEDLNCREITAALKERVPISDVKVRHARVSFPTQVVEAIGKLRGTLEAVLYNEQLEQLTQMPVNELTEKLSVLEGVGSVVFDGIITQRLVDLASERGVKLLIADRVSEQVRRPVHLRLLTFDEVAPESAAK
ncbi:MAG: DNA primase DnaG [Candidatus Bathyarchaeia archaeon]